MDDTTLAATHSEIKDMIGEVNVELIAIKNIVVGDIHVEYCDATRFLGLEVENN